MTVGDKLHGFYYLLDVVNVNMLDVKCYMLIMQSSELKTDT